MMPLRVAAYFPLFMGGSGNHSHSCLSICEHLRSPELNVALYVPSSMVNRPFVHEAIPRWLRGIVYRIDPSGRAATDFNTRRYRRALSDASAAYVWAASPMRVYEDATRASVPVIMERINCHQAAAIRILDDAYRRAGLEPAHGITAEAARAESRKLSLAYRVFAPSPHVERYLLEQGVPAEKVLRSTYGWSPERIAPGPFAPRRAMPPAFAFVGTLCVRKGAHLLLDYWSAAAPRARLSFYGKLQADVKAVASRYLGRADVELHGHVDDVARAYRASGVLVLPTVEEGSPLVVYEAMAHGLAILTTPMGAGDVVRDGLEGIVLDPYDRDAWVEALRRLATDDDLRGRLGAAAAARAQEFTWRKVGARRRALLIASLRAAR